MSRDYFVRKGTAKRTLRLKYDTCYIQILNMPDYDIQMVFILEHSISRDKMQCKLPLRGIF